MREASVTLHHGKDESFSPLQQSNNQSWINESIINQRIDQWIPPNQSINQPSTTKAINRWIINKTAIHRQINQSSANQSINYQRLNQSTSHSSENESTNKSIISKSQIMNQQIIHQQINQFNEFIYQPPRDQLPNQSINQSIVNGSSNQSSTNQAIWYQQLNEFIINKSFPISRTTINIPINRSQTKQ